MTSRTLILLLVGSTPAFSQSSHPTTEPQHPSEAGIQRIENQQFDRVFTARDLLGKNVVNYDGERLGTINDMALGGDWTERFGTNVAADKSSAGVNDESVVYVSTGGILGVGGRLGMGANWVSVPVERLVYDRANDRFILDLTAGRFTAIAEGRPRIDPGASTTAGTSRPGTIGGVAEPVTPSDPLQRIETALGADPDITTNPAGIRVRQAGDVVELTGQVRDARQIRRAGDIAREHTEMEVRNLLQTEHAAAE